MSDVNDTIQICYFASKIGPEYNKLLVEKEKDKKNPGKEKKW